MALMVLWLIVLAFIENSQAACDRMSIFNKEQEAEFGENVTHANFYYVYGYSLFSAENYSMNVNSSLYLRAIQERSEYPFFIYEDLTRKEVQISFESEGFKYSSLKLDEYSAFSSKHNKSECVMAIESNVSTNMVFLLSCKLMIRKYNRQSFKARVLWIEGRYLEKASAYAYLWDHSYEIHKYNLTGFNYSDKCEELATFLEGCKLPSEKKNFYLALLVGIVAILAFLIFSVMVGGKKKESVEQSAQEDEKY